MFSYKLDEVVKNDPHPHPISKSSYGYFTSMKVHRVLLIMVNINDGYHNCTPSFSKA